MDGFQGIMLLLNFTLIFVIFVFNRSEVKLLMTPTVSYTVAYDKDTNESILQRGAVRFAPVEIFRSNAKVLFG